MLIIATIRVRRNHIWKSRPKRNGKEKHFPHYIHNYSRSKQIFINAKKIRLKSPTYLVLFAFISASPSSHTFKTSSSDFFQLLIGVVKFLEK